MPERPNVLWICTDQQSASAMSCAGNDQIDTPAMDSIADAGTRFTRSYCTHPLCTPSRASLLTGRMPQDVGVRGNQDEIDPDYRDQELGTLFASAGYDCAYAGKFHLPNPRHIDDGHGFEELCGMDDIRTAELSAQFLRERDSEDDPFFLSAHLDNPHNICEFSRDYTPPWGLVEDVPTEEYPPLPANHAKPPYEPKIIRDVVSQHWAMGAMEGATPDEWREYRHGYFRLVEKADARLAQILDALREASLEDETLVVFTSDHGDSHGAHQLIQKTFLYEEMVNVPLIVSPPEATPGDGGDTADQLVSNGLDLLPTLCSYAGIEVPEPSPGRSLEGIVSKETPEEWRDYVVTETVNDDAGLDGRMVRTEQYKYVVYHEQRHNEQLFDLESDPGEMVDLSNSAAHQDVLDEHRDLLLEWCLDTGDRFGERYNHPDVPMIPGYDFETLWPMFTDDPPGLRYGDE